MSTDETFDIDLQAEALDLERFSINLPGSRGVIHFPFQGELTTRQSVELESQETDRVLAVWKEVLGADEYNLLLDTKSKYLDQILELARKGTGEGDAPGEDGSSASSSPSTGTRSKRTSPRSTESTSATSTAPEAA